MSQSQKKVDPEGAGRSIDRRDFLKAAGAGGAVATIGASSSSELAPIGRADAQETGPCTPFDFMEDHVVFIVYQMCSDVIDHVEQNPAQIESYLHALIVSEYESFGMIQTILQNRLEDARTLAHIEARHAIASSYEDGLTEEEAHEAALGAIDEYYSVIKINTIEAATKSLLQNAFVNSAARSAGDIQSSFCVPELPDSYTGTGEARAGYQQLLTDTVDVEWTLYSEGTHVVSMPQYEFDWDNGGGKTSFAPTEGEWNSYDDSTGLFTIETDDGETIETGLGTNVGNVPIAEGDDLPGHTGFQDDKFVGLLDQLDNEWSQVRNQYPEDFVTDLYGLLDNTDLSPSDIRGIDGMARNLAGTSDATSSAYRLALQMMLDMEQADLTNVSHQEVTISAATDQNVQEVNGEQVTLPSDYVTQSEREGLLFGRGIPNSVLKTGASYVLDGFFVTNTGTIYDREGNQQFDAGIPESDWVTWYPDANRIVSYDGTNIVAYHRWTGEEIWSRSGDGPVVRLTTGNGIVVDGSSIVEINLESGAATGISMDTVGSPNGPIAVSENESLIYVAEGSDLVAYNYDGSGSESWRTEFNSGVRSVDVSPDGETIAVGTRNAAHKLNADGAKQGSVQPESGSYQRNYYVAVGGETFFAANAGKNPNDATAVPGEAHLAAYSRSDLSQQWKKSWSSADEYPTPPDGHVYGLRCDIDGSRVALDADVYFHDNAANRTEDFPGGLFDGVDGSLIVEEPGMVTTGRRSAAWPDITGRIDAGYFYDAAEGGELQLMDGFITIDSQQNSEGEEIDETEYDQPEYDTNDVDTFEEYIIQLEEAVENLQNDPVWDPGDIVVGIGDFFDDAWPLSLVETAIAAVAVWAGVNILGDSS